MIPAAARIPACSIKPFFLLLFCDILLTYQPVVHFLIFGSGYMPGEICGHGSVNHLVSLALFIIIDTLRIADGLQHLVSIVISKAETGTGTLVFIVRLYCIL